MLMSYFHSLDILESSVKGKSVASQSRAFLINIHHLLF